MQDTPLLTIPQAARRLNVPESWLRDKVTARKVPHRRLGKHIRFGEDDLEQIAEQARCLPVSPRRTTASNRAAAVPPRSG
ncbi:helix-turn-helix domain-containing protein [Streptomonospora salina]|uniref:Excisionase family DNA binding protein n=1 Tax=Streptomonospora salina TaxID=104205 RepID=A0A841E6I6_9ACTN|nr:helix-turn-helix domain-containing protein [Streptomonospora salina]MBB5998422.1 excisionase family DNA binding protein [Streptomonospora salina]